MTDEELAALRCCPRDMCQRPASEQDDACRRDALIDELEKARGERDNNAWCKTKLIEMRNERDAAYALLLECSACFRPGSPLRARIKAMVGNQNDEILSTIDPSWGKL